MYPNDMPEPFRGNLLNQKMPDYEETPCAGGPPLTMRRISMISTAGLHRCQEPPFVPGRGEFRLIPDDTNIADLITSHVAPNFDRTGMMRDINTVFPIDRLRELEKSGAIASVAANHYGFMGATPPTEHVELAKNLATDMKADGVDGVLLAGV
jgi:D-proline reductase (dithiol) PrdB